MERKTLTKSMFARLRADTKRAIQSFWFWVLEAGGAALMAFFDQIWSVVWLVGGLTSVWIGATASALFKQRNEARAIATTDRLMSLEPTAWIPLDDALQIRYDTLTSGAYDASGQLSRMITSLGAKSSDLWDHVGAWLIDGIQKDEISATAGT